VTYDFRIDFNNDGDFDDAGENVTSRILGREAVTVAYGRDQLRSQSPLAAGQASFLLDNRSRDYSPENASSPLSPNILPARPVRIQKTHQATTYTLFRGFTDDFDVQPYIEDRSVKVTCLDLLARFRDIKISTELHQGIRTGDAVGFILDEMGWPSTARDVDAGATVMPWWWEQDADAFEALTRVVNSEGLPALATVDSDGNFVFRDRHHRLIRSASVTSQATFRDLGAEPQFSAPLIYDHGWRDIINSVTLSVSERAAVGELENVFESTGTFSISTGETRVLAVESTDPFIGAVAPEVDTDYTVQSGAVEVSLSRTSGASTTIFIKATSGAVVAGMRLRAYPVREVTTYQVQAEDSTSISRYGRRSYTQDAPWVGINDAGAIAAILLAYRAERLPIVSFRMVSGFNGNPTRMAQMLSRDLSDRITVVDAETGLNDDFFIERIEHTISDAGAVHETVFGCEKVPTQVANVFILGSATRGVLGTNRLGKAGLDDPATVFILGSGVLGTNLLGR
jgi:hypothetical protein